MRNVLTSGLAGFILLIAVSAHAGGGGVGASPMEICIGAGMALSSQSSDSENAVTEGYVQSHFDEGSFHHEAIEFSRPFAYDPKKFMYRGMRMSVEDFEAMKRNGLHVAKTTRGERIDFSTLPEDSIDYAFFPAYRSGPSNGKFLIVMVQLDVTKAPLVLKGTVVRSFTQDIPLSWISNIYLYHPSVESPSERFSRVDLAQ